jgi:N6-L-threonylcarbamoyladenine synthase
MSGRPERAQAAPERPSWPERPGLSGVHTVLGIETSCDETAAAVVVDGREVLSSVVSSQVDLHARFGGVVPEVASRAHVELVVPVVAQAVLEAGIDAWARASEGGRRLDAVAATAGPGLIGALLVGLSAAKALALAWGLPFVAVNHLEGHLCAALLDEPEVEYPFVVALLSGGHTMLVAVDGPQRYRLLGQTIDDAAGEAFDKVARFLGLGYPGGPAIDRAAERGDPEAVPFPRALAGEGYDFSFSGLKTAVVTYVRAHPEASVEDVAASFRAAVVDVVVDKARRALRELGARGLCLAGGVAANAALRARVSEVCAEEGVRAYLPSREMCTDNAAMIAAAGWWRLRSDGPSGLDVGADPTLALAFA